MANQMAVSNLRKPLLLTTCIAMAVMAGCSKGPKVEEHKPSKLPKVAQMQTLTPVFKESVGGSEKYDPLRLQLDASNQAIYAVSRKGEVVAYDLKGKKIALQDVTSTAGYTFPIATIKKDTGIDATKDMKIVNMKGHDQAVISLLNGDVDAAAVFQDARNIVKKDQPNVFKDTKILKLTKPIPNDTISVRPDMNKDFQDKLKKAFKDISKTKEGHKIISEVYSHEGYTDAKDSDFDIVRKYEKEVQNMK